jgi:hypothetical protein
MCGYGTLSLAPPLFFKKTEGPHFFKNRDKELSILVEKFDTMPHFLIMRHANLALLSLE